MAHRPAEPPHAAPRAAPGPRVAPAEGATPGRFADLRVRAISAVGLVVVAVSQVLLGGWFFAFFVVLAIVMMAREWQRLATPIDPVAGLVMTVLVVAFPVAAVLATKLGAVGYGFAILFGGCLVAAGLAALLPAAPVDRMAGGVLYIGLPTVALTWLHIGHGSAGAGLVLWLFVIVWATDVGAFLAGRAIGGPRLAPAISPNKTWAGLAGAALSAAVIGGLAALFLGWPAWRATGLAVVLAMIAQAGDFFESWLKRAGGIKDTGRLIPGHGGLLDRVDGLLFAAPAFALLIAASGFAVG